MHPRSIQISHHKPIGIKPHQSYIVIFRLCPCHSLRLLIYSLSNKDNIAYVQCLHLCRNPTLAKCGGEAQHLEKVGIGVLRDSRKLRRRFGRPKHLALGCFWWHWKRSWNLDIENALAFSIWTSAAQVMGKRRVGSQTGSLTPDH